MLICSAGHMRRCAVRWGYSRMVDGPNESGAVSSPDKSGDPRSRRSRRSKRSGNASVSAIFQISHRHLSRAVLAILVLTLLAAAMKFWSERTFYPQIWLGATPAETRYGFGEPQKVRQNGALETWAYTFSGYEEFVEFENGKATKVGCETTGGACPGVLDIKGGTLEDEIYTRLGLPSDQELSDGKKMIVYRDISLSLKLQKFRVTSIDIEKSTGISLSNIYRFIVFLMP
jgi:hypothetical protein